MSILLAVIQQAVKDALVTKAVNEPDALRIGLLGTSLVAPGVVITPAYASPNIIVHGVASRFLVKAEHFAKKHGIPKAYDGYQAMLDDPDVDAVYNALPNRFHFEWTIKALKAGKHVLNEKPLATNLADAEKMYQMAKETNLVLLDGYYSRFHPALALAREQIASLGPLVSLDICITFPKGFFPAGDIRWSYELGGGAALDIGCHAFHTVLFLTSQRPKEAVSVTSIPSKVPGLEKLDVCTDAQLRLEGGGLLNVHADLEQPPLLGFLPRLPTMSFKAVCQKGEVAMDHYLAPSITHTITVTEHGKERIARDYGNGWSAQRYQLETFVTEIKAVRAGRLSEDGLETRERIDDSLSTLRTIDMVYEQSLGPRAVGS